MPGKVIRLGTGEQPAQKQQLSDQNTEASTLSRVLGGAATSALGLIPNTAQAIVNAIGLPSARGGRPDIAAQHSQIPGQTSHLRDIQAKATGVTRESLEPKNKTEEFFNMLAADSPFIAAAGLAGGVPAALSAGKNFAAANLGMKGAHELGLGPIGEIAGALFAPAALNKAGSLGKRILNRFQKGTTFANKVSKTDVLQYMKDSAAKNYKSSEQALKDKYASADSLKQALEERFAPLREIPSDENKSLVKLYDAFIEKIVPFKNGKHNQLDINKAKNWSKTFKREAYNLPEGSPQRELYRQTGEDIRDWIYSQESNLGKPITEYIRANDIWTITKGQEGFEKMLNADSALRNLFSKSTLKHLIPYIGKKLGAIPISRMRFLIEPEGRQYWYNAIDAIDFGNKKEALLALRKLGQYAEKYEKSEKPQQQKSGKGRVIKLGSE